MWLTAGEWFLEVTAQLDCVVATSCELCEDQPTQWTNLKRSKIYGALGCEFAASCLQPAITSLLASLLWQ